MGYVTTRIVECTFILAGILAMLAIATLRQQSAGAAEATHCSIWGFRRDAPILSGGAS